jgi:hypothetical protein
VTYFLRAVELTDGIWVCKRGRAELGVFLTREEALAHLDEVAATLDGPVEVRVHPCDVDR